MEIRSFAERILHGRTLADKRVDPGRPTDARPGPPMARPRSPARPEALAFVDRRTGPTAPMARSLLDTEHGRGRVLHAFANHELLALELMALALLCWPDADPAFRRGLVATMVDEQRHLGAYLDRMAACGVALGEVPVSRFFWDVLADAPDPARFMAGLGLVLEQANLDFSVYWGAAFADAGDADTAAVLAEVHRDELRHVRHAWLWWSRWRKPTFAAFEDDLTFPLTAARARGPTFDADGRRRAGLPEAFVDAVRVAAHSKGRPPRVLWFRPDVEAELAHPGGTRSAAVQELTADLAWVVAMDAGADDVVIAPTTPPVALRRTWAEAGLPVPRFVTQPAELDGPVGALDPWGWSPSIRRALAPLAGDLTLPAEAPHLSSKAWWAERRPGLLDGLPGLDPLRLGRILEVDGGRWTVEGPVDRPSTTDGWPDRWVAKAPISASGQLRIRGDGPPSAAHRAWIARVLRQQGAVVVEPWWTGLVDLSVQGRVTADGVRIDGITRFETAHGRYRGTWLGGWTRGLSRDVARFVHETDVGATLHAVGERVGAVLADAGHRGPFGVDAMIVDDCGPALHPLVEVNARWTMGRVALALARRVRRGAPAWLRLGPASAPIPAIPVERRRGQLVRGVVPLGDPATARRVLPLLVVGEP